MDENDKIKQVVQKYDSYFMNFSGDVAHTTSGSWLFFEYDKVSEDYDGFIRFNTAEELEKIVIDKLANGVICIFETVAENMHQSFRKLDDEIYNGHDMNGVTKLTRELELMWKEYHKKGEKLELLLKLLSGVLLDGKYKS